MTCYVVIQGFQNRAHYRLCSILGFAEARPPVYWLTSCAVILESCWRNPPYELPRTEFANYSD